MKVIAYTALHYGREYLKYAIWSVIDAVDEYYVLYTPTGSHGTRTGVKCPESRHSLYREAVLGAGDKLRWIDGQWDHEGNQRDSIFKFVPDADMVLVLDADEIWAPGLAEKAITAATSHPQIRNWRMPMQHYWRSFKRCILHDPAYPVRLINTRASGTENTLDTPLRIHHMGYAQSAAIVRYKLLTHGHRGEFRRDCDWFNDKFLANAQRDCHPVGSDYWNPEPVNPAAVLPPFMKTHPFWDKDLIE
jgi:hypothetical protein